MKLLGIGNTKTLKGQKLGYMTFIMHLSPSDKSGRNVCPMATRGCRAACLDTAGRGKFDMTQAARIRKTDWFFDDRDSFMVQLVKDVEAGVRKAAREGFIPVFRLNGTSDIRWEIVPVDGHRNIMDRFSDLTFYDYTKIPNRRGIPKNYHLVFSRADGNEKYVDEALVNGMNIAVVFDTKKKEDLPVVWNEINVIDGDISDLRFLDPTSVVVGLRSKGDAKHDTTGFVVRV